MAKKRNKMRSYDEGILIIDKLKKEFPDEDLTNKNRLNLLANILRDLKIKILELGEEILILDPKKPGEKF